jgi:glycosyltransferase involved in cell wall biosynthesis
MGGIVLKSGITSERLANNLSVVIITLNEARNLKSLLPEVPKGAEIILVDSGSTDETVSLAESFGAKVFSREFDGYASQKNFAMSKASKAWTLCLDADERPDGILWRKILDITTVDEPSDKFYSLKRRLVFQGKPLTHGRSMDRVVRLFRTGKATYKNEIHEKLVPSARTTVEPLPGTLWHWSYYDLDDYFSRFNRYTSMMAKARFDANKNCPPELVLAMRLPVDFVSRYFLKLGFLDGWPGFLWALFGSFYGFVKYAKLRELYRDAAGGK